MEFFPKVIYLNKQGGNFSSAAGRGQSDGVALELSMVPRQQ